MTSRATPASLTSHYWDFHSIRDAQGAVRTPVLSATAGSEGRTPRLTFTADRVAATGLCNTMVGSYTAAQGTLQIGRVMSTMVGCLHREMMELEQLIGKQLPQVQRYELRQTQPPQLVLSLSDGSQWELHGTATPETKYGGTSTRIFWEVAPQRQACTHPLIPQHQCLQVREIRYNEPGLKTHIGAWEHFYGNIEGYTHRPGQRNVLRLKRFERLQPAADASRYAYVLDMIVETEIVR